MDDSDRKCNVVPGSRRALVLLVLALPAATAGVVWLVARFAPDLPALILAPAAAAVATAAFLPLLRCRGEGVADLPDLRRAEQILRQAEEGILTINARGQVMSLNPAAETLFGYRTAEVENQPVTMLMAEPPSQTRPNPLRDTLPSGSILGLAAGAREVIGKRKNGETFALELTGGGMLLGEDAVSVAFVRDVSKRKRAQRYLLGHYAATCVLAEAGSLADAVPRILQAVCESLQWDAGAYWAVDPATGQAYRTETYQSPTAGLLRWPEGASGACKSGEGLPGRVWSTGQPGWVEDLVVAKEDACRTAAGNLQLRGAFGFPILIGQDVCGVLTFFSCRKQKRDEQLLGIVAELGKQLGHFVARKRQEEVLRETTQTLQALVTAAPVAIHIADMDGKVRLWNPAAERIFGWSATEVLGRPLPTTDGPAGTGVTPLPGGHSEHSLQSRCRRKDGTLIDVSRSTAPLRDSAGNVFGVMGIGMDLTEQRNLENQLRQAQKMEAVGQLAGGIAHDFNNLLTIITGYCEVLLGMDNQGETARGCVEEVHKAGQRAAGLTRQLLAFSRKQIIQPRVLDLNAAVADVQKMLGRLIGEHIQLYTSLAPSLGRVSADPGQIEQVLVNLAVNARDAMPAGGKLTIETSDVWVGEGHGQVVPGLGPGRYARLAVCDTGCGMDPRTLARVFEPFFTTKGTGKGTGLGLATVYGIVKQSGGHVSATSEVGKGSTFEVYLPIVADAPADGGAAADSAPTPCGNETILLVEDEDAVRALARQVLQGKGYTVLEASNGEDALRLAEKNCGTVDLLLTDVVMPRVGGRALAEALIARHPNLSVLYISGYTDDEVLRSGVRSSENAFLQKPFSPDELLHKVRKVLDKDGPSTACLADRPRPQAGRSLMSCVTTE